MLPRGTSVFIGKWWLIQNLIDFNQIGLSSYFKSSFKDTYLRWSQVGKAHVVDIVNFVTLDNSVALVYKVKLFQGIRKLFIFTRFTLICYLTHGRKNSIRSKSWSSQVCWCKQHLRCIRGFWHQFHMFQQIKIIENKWVTLGETGKNNF